MTCAFRATQMPNSGTCLWAKVGVTPTLLVFLPTETLAAPGPQTPAGAYAGLTLPSLGAKAKHFDNV